EIQDLLRASVGLNLALDFLPGSVMFDPAAGDKAPARIASEAVWFDAFVTNVDRTPRNPNLLIWHKELYFIDHGAALYFHHSWGDVEAAARSRFPAIRSHVLLPWATELEAAHERLTARLSIALFRDILEQVPDEWLIAEPGSETAASKREGYLEFFKHRLDASAGFLEEALLARAALV
ncbi:MAG TPA: HipA family kinase, partial [Bryobacteraceae bacterium]|nr:HipA family kinase [Bryobacteraceae bacterium]